MARSELGRALRRLAEEHRAGDALGMTAEQVHALPPDQVRLALSRRDLLRGAAVVAAGMTVSATLPARPARAAGAPRVVVVGAGISGLAAALRLQDSGVSSTVYEANTRIGGRMYSRTSWADGQVSEWGGELIDTGHKTVQTLARRFGLQLDDLVGAEPNGSEPTYSFDGGYYPYKSASGDFAAVHNAVQKDGQTFTWPVTYGSTDAGGIALSDLSLWDWIETRVPGGHGSPMGKLLDLAYTIEYGGQTRDQTALNLLGLLGYQSSPGNVSIFGLSDERYHVRGGNQQLPVRMAAALTTPVRTGWQLTALAANSDGTQTLTFTVAGRTTTVIADHTVLALPLGVLQRLDLTRAGFDRTKSDQIATMRMGRNCKLNVQFSGRGWNTTGPWPGISTGETYSDTGYQNTWDVTRAQPGASGILVNFTGGTLAGSFNPDTPFTTQSSPQTVGWVKTFLAQLEPVLPGVGRTWNGQATMAAWHVNPWSYGAYSYWPVGYCHRYAGYERVRQGNVHFAGEHCSIDFQGYMEGGAVEGQRAGAEVLGDLGLK